MIAEKIKAPQGISVALRAPSTPWGETSHEVGPHQGAVAAPPDPEVPAKPARRRFTADYKLRILTLADACTELGSLGALLRREGLYSSNLTAWRRQRDEGLRSALTPRKRGRKGTVSHPLIRENEELRKANERLTRRLQQAELIIDVQKKVSQMLGIPRSAPEEGGND
jgi:transposase-like protein